MNLKIDEATVHLAMAAFRLGARDAGAQAPKSFLRDCVDLIQSDTSEQSEAIISKYRNDS